MGLDLVRQWPHSSSAWDGPAAGLLRLWQAGFVEPVVPPPSPRHIAAQQLLALALQEGTFGRAGWRGWWGDLSVMAGAQEVLDYLTGEGFLESDGDLLFIGPAAERRFGRRHFMDLTAVFTADPELRVVHGRAEVGSVSPVSLTARLPQGRPRVLALAGRAWVVTHVDWRRRVVNVAPFEGRGHSRWSGGAGAGIALEVAQSMRAVLLGEEPGVPLSRRGVSALERLRTEQADTVRPDGTVLAGDQSTSRWWTYAGAAANTSLAAALDAGGYEATADSLGITLSGRVEADQVRAAAATGLANGATPAVTEDALDGVKFSAALPREVAEAVLADRMTQPDVAREVATARITHVR